MIAGFGCIVQGYWQDMAASWLPPEYKLRFKKKLKLK